MELDYRAIGIRIRRFRKERGMTQQVLAEQSRQEPSNISHIERGGHQAGPAYHCQHCQRPGSDGGRSSVRQPGERPDGFRPGGGGHSFRLYAVGADGYYRHHACPQGTPAAGKAAVLRGRSGGAGKGERLLLCQGKGLPLRGKYGILTANPPARRPAGADGPLLLYSDMGGTLWQRI